MIRMMRVDDRLILFWYVAIYLSPCDLSLRTYISL